MTSRSILRWTACVAAITAFGVVPYFAAAQAPDAGAPATSATAPDGGLPPNGTTTAAPGSDGGAPAMPWAGASELSDAGAPALPSFLETTDRRIQDTRPPPSAEQVAALREMEAEIGRFATTGGSYRDTVVSIVRREYLRQRRARDEGYARQIREEERLQNEARDRAITLFERFVARYPDDPTYTPDAMFRLGELYFERSAITYQEEMEAYLAERDRRTDANEPVDTLTEPVKDFTPTINLYQQMSVRFPQYRHIDGVYYLIGYCLNEMDKPEEALLAWLNLVCGNRYTYTPGGRPPPEVAPGAQLTGEETDGGVANEHPALTMDMPPPAIGVPGTFVDPYEGCTPAAANTQFFAEVWLRIGEYHFDLDFDENGLNRAISAYNHVLTNPEDRNYNLALYKVAWAYYRASRYPEALRHFAMLVQWSDDQEARTGRAGTELRAEALQYLGLTFAYDDWNENQVPDPTEGMPTGIVRVQDTNLLPQDRPWTAEVYFQLGNIYFDEAKYPQAIEVWELALRRWPNHQRAPEIQNMIARAHTRNNEMEEAILARNDLSRFAVGTEWWNANVDHPSEQRLAEQLAENALIGTAVHHHTQAQLFRRRCVENQDPELCRRAQEQYRLAAEAYRGYIQRYPNNPQAYDLQYNLADALFWSEDYEQAAREYAGVRDSNLDDSHLSESARRVVESLKKLVERAVAAGQLQERTEPPPATGQPPAVQPIAMPDLLQRIAQAREIYLARVDERHDTENVRESYDYNNALLLYLYGYWPQATQRLGRIFTEHCSGPAANDTGRVAWLNLRNMAVALNQTDEVERLATQLRERSCTFAEGPASARIDCTVRENRDNPRCIAEQDVTNLQYRRALEIFHRAEQATGDDQRRLYEESATMLVRAVNDEPNHPEAPIALEMAALALERTSRFESAARLFQRIIDEIGPKRAETPEEQERLDLILSNAYFRLAYNANRFFDYDRAIQNYQTLADSNRFSASQNTDIRQRREDALINAAKIFEYQQQYARAAEYYRRAADMLRDPATKRAAYYRIAEMAYKQHNWRGTITEMQSFISRYQSDREAGELVVQAYWRIAEARKQLNQTRDYTRGLEDVVAAFSRSGQQPGSFAAEYAAEAKFRLVDTGIASFESFAIRPGSPRTLEAYVQTVISQISEGGRTATSLTEGYTPVTGYRRPTWSIAAFVRQGRIYEVLAKAVLNTPFAMPADLTAQLRRAPAEAREEVRIQVEDRIRQVLDQQVRPIECLAVARYALAARAARAGSIDNEFTRIATERLSAYGDERIAECVAQAAARDPSFGAYQTGEFSRAPRGQNLPIQSGVAAPPLASDDPPPR